MFDLGTQELILIFIVAFLVFGPKRLPELARTLGKGLRELKAALRGVKDSIEEADTSVSKEVEEAKTGIEKSITKGIQLEDTNEEEEEDVGTEAEQEPSESVGEENKEEAENKDE